MPVRITCRNMELSPEMHDKVEKKAHKLKKFFDKVDKIDIIFNAEKHRHICEINVHAGHFNTTAICENGSDIAAYEKALKTAIRQIKESKDRMITLKQASVNPDKGGNRSGGRMARPPVEAPA
ncbi:ribosome-associated translation inhibitor RaiA [Candidatus Sumerlaeota bacterium]|nr:ribosome-associated translation inhibitor RaiA [Candidatus Sumerlaeota bacterium]